MKQNQLTHRCVQYYFVCQKGANHPILKRCEYLRLATLLKEEQLLFNFQDFHTNIAARRADTDFLAY